MQTPLTLVLAIYQRLMTRLTLLILGLLLLGLPPAHAQSVRFAVIGDFGDASQNELDVSNLVKSWNPNFIITVGDNNYEYGSASTIDQNIGQFYHNYIYPYTGSYGAGAATNQFFPSLGNHDWGDFYPNPTGDQPYLNYFTLPNNERYYDVLFSPVHLFAIDSDSNEPDGNTSSSIQASWLQSRLTTSTAPWKLVYFHHPAYSSGSLGSNTWMQWPFQTWGATAVLAGHDHVYERLLINGLPYFTDGLGGAGISSFGTTVPGSQVRYNGDYGAMLVNADTSSIKFQFYTRTGLLIDSYSLSAPSGVPAAPTNLTATFVSTSQINLSWTDNATNAAGYYIEQSLNGTTFTQIATVGATAASYPATNLTADTLYYFRVRAYNAAGNSAYSNVATGITATIPAAPTNLAAAAISTSQINLSWTNNATNADGDKIEQSLDGTTFTQIATVGSSVTSYMATNLTANTLYYFRVRAYNAAGNSGYSNVATSSTVILAAPTNLTTTLVSSSQINLSWTNNATNAAGYYIEQSLNGTTFTQIATVGANVSSYKATSLAANTLYYFRVRAYNASGNSAYSNVATGNTSPPAVPTNLTATAASSSQINLSWTENDNNVGGFQIWQSQSGGAFVQIAQVGATPTSFSAVGLNAKTTYSYQVRAFNAAGTSAYSNTATARTRH